MSRLDFPTPASLYRAPDRAYPPDVMVAFAAR
jgi:hypothetical protein